MMKWIVNAPRWLMLVALVYAPWAYGSTRPWTVHVLNALLAVVLIGWAVSAAGRRRWPVVPFLLVGAAGLLVAQAWWMSLNAKFDYNEADLEFNALTPLFAWAPGSIDRSLSIEMAMRITVLLGTTCFVADLARRPVWRTRLLRTMAWTGSSLVLFGLIQRGAAAPGIFWEKNDMGPSFFATFRYHSNAGAFINLIWPLQAGLLVASFRKGESAGVKAAWTASLFLCWAGVLVNASRAASVLAVLLLGLWVGWLSVQVVRGRLQGINPGVGVVAGLLVLLLIGAMAATAGLDLSWTRWAKLGQEWSADNPRLLVWKVGLRMMAEAGWWGYGPGTFQTAFPYFTHQLGNTASGVWLYAHQDYLQTAIEWGYIGATLWGICVFGRMISALVAFRRDAAKQSLAEQAVSFSLLLSVLGVLLHALVDYPLQVASIQLYVAVLLGMFWSSRREAEETGRKG